MQIRLLVHGLPRPTAIIFLLLLPAILACGLVSAPPATPTAAPTPLTSPTAPPITLLGTSDNPVILALPPSTHPTQEMLDAGKTLAGLLQRHTGFVVVPVVPPSEPDLVSGFGNGNAHIGVLSPFGYLLASNAGNVEAAFAREHNGAIFYGSQFIAHADTGVQAYYDAVKNGNLATAAVALSQFQDKKPCWSDDRSPSGYVVPLGTLKLQQIRTRDPAFLAGHAAVVRAIDVGGICDFGATYIDARTYPGLQDQYPDLMKKVQVIWRIPPIIPYETLVFVHGMDDGVRRALTRAFVDLEATPEGKSAMQILYGFDAMQIVQDSQYNDFREAVKASGIDLNALIK